MTRLRHSALVLGIGSAAVGAAAAIAVLLTDDPRIGLLAAAGTAYLSFIVWRTSARAVTGAIALFAIPPAVLGESSSTVALIGMLVLWLVLATYPASSHRLSVFPIWTAFLALAAGMLLFGAPIVIPGLYIFGLFVAAMMVRRAELVQQILKALALLIAPLALSYIVTMVTGFTSATTLKLGSRTVEMYAPFTLATSGPPIIPGTRRFTLLVGEPGLSVFFLLPLLALVLASSARFVVKILGVAAVAIVAVIGQSFATLAALALAILLYVVLAIAKRYRHPLLASILSVAALLAGLPFLYDTLIVKSTVAAESVTDRGIFNAGEATTASLGNINLLVTVANNPALAACIAVALVAMAVLAARSLIGVSVYFAFAITAIAAQPSQWQIGAWIMLVAAFVIGAARSTPDEGDAARDEALSRRRALADSRRR